MLYHRIMKKDFGFVKTIKHLIGSSVFVFKREVVRHAQFEILKQKGVVRIGRHTYGKPIIFAWNHDTKLIIGNFCSISEDVKILLGGEHSLDTVTTYPFNIFRSTWGNDLKGSTKSKGDVQIGNDVWLGHSCIILSGVTIGNGAVVAAGSVVVKDVPSFAIVGGNPASVIRFRFDTKTISELEGSKWWDWSDAKVKENLEYILSFPDSNKIN